MPQPHYSWRGSVQYLLDMRMGRLQSYFGQVGEQKSQSFCRQSKANSWVVQLVTYSQYVQSYLGSLGVLVIIIIIIIKDWTSLIRSVSRVTTVLANVSSVFQLFSFLVVCSGMISKGFSFVAFFASVNASSVCIHLSCPVCL